MDARPPVDHVIVPYDRERHEPFVMSSWRAGGRHDRRYMASMLARPDVKCVVALPADEPAVCLGCEGEPAENCTHPGYMRDVLYGWAAAVPHENVLLWVYVRFLWGTLRKRGLGSALMRAAGLDTGKRTDCPFWSPDAVNLCRAGHKLVFTPTEESQAATYDLKAAALLRDAVKD